MHSLFVSIIDALHKGMRLIAAEDLSWRNGSTDDPVSNRESSPPPPPRQNEMSPE